MTLHREDAEAAYLRHRVSVFNYLRRCGVPRKIAEELTQATFVVLLEKPGRFDAERGSLVAFLLGMARHLRLAWLRPQRVEAAEPTEPSQPYAGAADTGADVWAAVLALPDGFRECVVLRDFHGFDYQEIAGLQGVPVGTVRSRLARARELLRIRLKGA